ncbi:hypothetical protein HanIR_Chr11g0555861 [Helianthus annuus]|nr:hypothetical protein HanIR_Chr11g0555861 [Helianthus annuus]
MAMDLQAHLHTSTTFKHIKFVQYQYISYHIYLYIYIIQVINSCCVPANSIEQNETNIEQWSHLQYLGLGLHSLLFHNVSHPLSQTNSTKVV